jgi:hypothetical protein
MSKIKKHFSLRKLSLAGVFLLALFGIIVVIYATVNGPNGQSDSVSYVVRARNLMRG